MSDQSETDELRSVLVALLAIAVDERESRVAESDDATKSEVILAGAGLSTQLIADVLGKKPDAVRKTLSRARAKA